MKPWLPLALVLVVLSGCDRPKSSQTGGPPSTPPQPSGGPTSAGASAGAGGAGNGGSSTGSPRTVSFDEETLGAPPRAFEPVVGDWAIAQLAGEIGLQVDGARWRDGTPAANLADQAKRLYGDRYAEFLDGVKAFAFFPVAIAKEPPPPGDVKLSVRFYPFGGKVDQAAGIAFGIAPDGSYAAVRANALEDNILYFTVVKGKRSIVDTIRDVPTPTRKWHTLVVELRGKQLTVLLDKTTRLDKTLEAAPSGRVGLWSKADSQVLFDDFVIAKL